MDRGKEKPEIGEQIRVNFSRVEWTTDVKDGKYVKVPIQGEDKIREYNWVWAPTGVINIHMPEYWGYVQISDKIAGEGETPFVKHPSEETNGSCVIYITVRMSSPRPSDIMPITSTT